MGNMEESKKVLRPKISPSSNDLLMKPFSMGWTREVVMRVITKSGAPNCDIYYLSPSNKRIRSSTELKSLLTDGLTLECFSFKKKPLGLSPDLEIVRNATYRGGKREKSKEKGQGALKKPDMHNGLKKNNCEMTDDCEKELKLENDATKNEISDNQDVEIVDKQNVKNEDKEMEEVTKNMENNPETQTTQSENTKQEEKISKQYNNFINKKKTKRKAAETKAPIKSVRLRKKMLKRMVTAKQAKQDNVVASRKILKRIVNIVKSPSQKLLKKNKKETSLKSTKNKKVKLNKGKTPLKNNLSNTKNETVKETESIEADKKPTARDLKSIVKKNIGKYREMREKQKLGAIKSHVKSNYRSTGIASTPKIRSEPISKNKTLYLKPLEKGWRRELVYRSTYSKAGQMADVYYFHPNGKKFRSGREIAENLTQGLSIECFTFRKEALGIGEPFEVVRNARIIQKN